MNAIIPSLRDTMSIVGFPCNQFAKQEPAANSTELYNGLRYVRPGSGYIPKFDIMKKIDVNGEKEAPLYTFLKESCPPTGKSSFRKTVVFSDPIKPNDITWNFEKFIIDERGVPMFRFLPTVTPEELVDLVKAVASGTSTKTQLREYLKEIDRIRMGGVKKETKKSNQTAPTNGA